MGHNGRTHEGKIIKSWKGEKRGEGGVGEMEMEKEWERVGKRMNQGKK
jgi:hypothetical protein